MALACLWTPLPWVDELGTTPMMNDVQQELAASAAYKPPSASCFQESEIKAVPDGFQFVEGMTLAEAYHQGFMAAQFQIGSFQ
jgi:hypothetical protein